MQMHASLKCEQNEVVDVECRDGKEWPGHGERVGAGTRRSVGPDSHIAAIRAAEQLALRRRRSELFGRDLFGEGAWDIMLDLLVAKFKGRRTTVKNACIAACVPTTTALRCLERLEMRGLVHRRRHETGKRTWLELDDGAYLGMVELLTRGVANLVL
jgi:hypothetical protein